MFSLIASALLIAQAWTPAALWRVHSEIDAAMQAKTLSGAHVTMLAVDAATGTELYARGADDDVVPASTFKLIAGSTALATLGPNFAYVTDVGAAGNVEGGTLQGDLYLRGGGDAQLSLDDLDAAAAAVAAAGIRHVSGALVGDSTRYNAPHYPAGWSVDDLPYGYAAVPSALSLDDNVAHVRVRPGAAVGDPAMLWFEKAASYGPIDIVDDAVTGVHGSDDTTDLVRPWDKPLQTRVVGSYPIGAAPSDDLEPAVPAPASWTLQALRLALLRHGVAIDDDLRYEAVPPGATVIWTHHSEPLTQILADCWQPSNNLLAEQLLEELGVRPSLRATQRYGDTRALGIGEEQNWLRSIGVDPSTLTIDDGSGLSSYDRVTARAMVAILTADWNSPQRDAVMAALPEAGVRGTLESTFAGTPLQGALFAKTGSLNHARLLAGYLRTQNHGTAIFALMINDWMGDSPEAGAEMTAARSAILTALLNG